MSNRRIVSLFTTILLLIAYSCQSHEQKYAGTWSSSEDKIVVNLDAYTMKAYVTIRLGDTPVSYTSDWEYVEGHGALFNNYYGHGQASIIGYDGKLYSFDS